MRANENAFLIATANYPTFAKHPSGRGPMARML